MITYLITLVSCLFGTQSDDVATETQSNGVEVNYNVDQTEVDAFYHS
ncbi:hypothetical protein FLSA109164_12570 [Flavobacterium saliperosum]|uniref:Uncharacterized protein n=1 Tax=Flavobacterium saliperosum TaxID=329186 RepID=A0A1G4V4W4_9FLAO|nr:hypothetical protein SAMN02927925_00290 [Flavobacterium saliperosum]